MNVQKTSERPAEDTRQRIIQAALTLFGRVGYAQTTTRAIAQEAGVNEVTLFRHFGTKMNLLSACVETMNAGGFAATFETELCGEYAEDVRRMAVRQMRDTLEHMDILRVLICDARNVPELREAMVQGGSGNFARLRNFFQRQIEAGVVRADVAPEALVMAFDSLFSTQLILENLFEGSFSPSGAYTHETAVDALVQIFVRGTQA
ncbi:TetR/AcrR family transcriptional regulator [Levilinea saccharolytica]|uniref:TetR/AcrR family transcriptional regulator n=1 Tax=Levilinea saccharolytica TaxID=229921 RepID=UPI000783286A|nr:TetR/AcrR family transcriptional regulator [Levilinea saccharolytica]GAP16558.1 transcriptional regulator, TetR family [Levilinea saccharolytica]